MGPAVIEQCKHATWPGPLSVVASLTSGSFPRILSPAILYNHGGNIGAEQPWLSGKEANRPALWVECTALPLHRCHGLWFSLGFLVPLFIALSSPPFSFKCDAFSEHSMAECDRSAAGRFRPWPPFSAATLRRKLLDAVACGASGHRRRRKEDLCSLASRPTTRRLEELMRAEEPESCSDRGAEAETRRKIGAFEELQRAAGLLQLGDGDGELDRRKEAAAEVRRLAKDDPGARKTFATLGAIPPLVAMLDSKDSELHLAALYALLNLGIGNDLNKAAAVKAGAVHKMLNLIESGSSPSVSEAIVANFLSLSALDSNKPVVGASGAIPFLMSAFKSGNSTARQDALRALFNLSIASSNAPRLVDAGLVPALFASIGDMEVSERALTALSNLVATGDGRRAVSRCTDAVPTLVDVLGWCDAAGCQEKAAHVLMVMAHKGGPCDRAAMVEAGAVSALLELTLLGSPLAQKRASRVLEVLTVDKGKKVTSAAASSAVAVSAPLSVATAAEGKGDDRMSEERRAVRELVQQSLHSNMRRITRRANLPQDFGLSERFTALTTTSATKSLPF
nr:PREDICTED: U-box domain-containing protein 4-like [Musa acuminata subsp. malaccensis]XP_018681526.1 PREDICTED: U-box domain-containing protein 4-like [Musa acuminata subsp. malaccensis]